MEKGKIVFTKIKVFTKYHTVILGFDIQWSSTRAGDS